MRIAFTDDFLRHPINGLDSHPANRRTLRGDLLPLARRLGIELVDISSGNSEISAHKAMAALQITPGINGWARAWDSEPTPDFLALVHDAFFGCDLIVGWELSNVIARALDKLSLSYVDVGLSPYRFGPEFFFSVRTNARQIVSVLNSLDVCPATLTAMAGELSAYHARRSEPFLVGRGARCGVFFGQTPIDSALIADGRLARVDEFLPQLKAWAEPLDKLFYKEHPYGDGSALEWMRRHFDIEVLNLPPYQILCAEDLVSVTAVSSGTCLEADCFGVPATTLIDHSRYKSGEEFSAKLAVRCEFLHHAVATVVKAELPASWFRPDYRFIIAPLWGDRFAR